MKRYRIGDRAIAQVAGEPMGIKNLEDVVEAISEEEIPELLMAIARRWRSTDNKILQVS